MERLRIIGQRKVDDLAFGQSYALGRENVTDLEILEIASGHARLRILL